MHAEAPVVANPEEAERAFRQVQQLQAGALADSWAEVPTIVGDIPSVSQRYRANADAPDLSPPRQKKHDSPDISPPRRKRHDSPDTSPPRKRHHSNHEADASQQHSTGDVSPPRKQRHDSPDLSPARRQQHHSPDLSPPRKRQLEGADVSPPRRMRHDSPDLSPVRQRHDSPDLSPARRPQHGRSAKHGRAENADPAPRQRRRHDSPDLSPPRHAGPQANASADAKRKGEHARHEPAKLDCETQICMCCALWREVAPLQLSMLPGTSHCIFVYRLMLAIHCVLCHRNDR